MFIHLLRILKKVVIGSVFMGFVSLTWAGTVNAAEIDSTTRTVTLNSSGDPITLTTKQLLIGQRKFNGTCSQCHLEGGTKPNPSVDLSPETLALATPSRNNVESIVDYLETPTTYDGLQSIADLHPSTRRTDIFPKMRDLTQEDLTAIAGYILVQPKIVGDQWAGGKPAR